MDANWPMPCAPKIQTSKLYSPVATPPRSLERISDSATGSNFSKSPIPREHSQHAFEAVSTASTPGRPCKKLWAALASPLGESVEMIRTTPPQMRFHTSRAPWLSAPGDGLHSGWLPVGNEPGVTQFFRDCEKVIEIVRFDSKGARAQSQRPFDVSFKV